MSPQQLYRWRGELWKQFSYLSKPLLSGLVVFMSEVIHARASQLTKIAEALAEQGKPDTVERRLQCWLANTEVRIAACQVCRMRWLLAAYGQRRPVLLVNETKLGPHLQMMLVGLPCGGRCVPLICVRRP